ncbi:MAG: N-acetyl sugar amidotransferase [Candidatus Omnitrophica bacterium]|nr:N-acetyl sugar amidotransferase [Candidatus Omnitrophota bacterium]
MPLADKPAAPPQPKPSSEALRRCAKCLLLETHDTIVFDEQGVCNVCRNIEHKQQAVDWAAKDRELRALLDAYRGKSAYDCLVPFSGGKDSTFTLYALVKTYGLRPLVVCFDHGFFRPTVLANTERAIRSLGVDFLKFRANWKVVKQLMLESLKRKGDFCWHCHTGIFSFPMQMALRFQVPLVIWGQPNTEYNAYFRLDEPELVDEKRFNRYINLGITAEDMQGMLGGGVTMQDLEPFRYPPKDALRALGYRSICLGSYIPWDVKTQTGIIKQELGWQEEAVEGVPGEYGYEKIECFLQGVRDYLRFIKRGMGRTNHLACIDIRDSRLTREEGLKLMQQHDGKRPASLDVFLELVGITEEEFNRIAAEHAVYPNKPDFSTMPKGEPLWDQPTWSRPQ